MSVLISGFSSSSHPGLEQYCPGWPAGMPSNRCCSLTSAQHQPSPLPQLFSMARVCRAVKTRSFAIKKINNGD